MASVLKSYTVKSFLPQKQASNGNLTGKSSFTYIKLIEKLYTEQQLTVHIFCR